MTKTWHDEVLVVIPSINGGPLLERMLPTLDFEPANVVVLDQGSTDDTARVCAGAGVLLQQLGRPHTYTQACNIGARLARERGCLYVCICNNDITFVTDVVAELRAEMGRDPMLGMVAPSQVVVDEASGERHFTSRVYWNLDEIDFRHDTTAVDRSVIRLEADFCELTCALVRLSAIEAIGFLDDEFGFYHEDADFGFRLHMAGYATAYLPQSQIDHYSSSTFGAMSTRKREYIARNRRHFTAKHLGYGVRPNLPDSGLGGPWDAFGCDLAGTLLRHGLVRATAPELVLARPGMDSAGYDYTDVQATPLPPRWARYADSYRAVFTATRHMRETFAEAGFAHSFHVPPGIETDVFHPWGPTRRLHDAPTILVFAEGWQTEWLATVTQAWRGLVAGGQKGWLVIAGHGLAAAFGTAPGLAYNAGHTAILRLDADRIELHDQLAPMQGTELAQFCRAMDVVVPNPDDPGLHLPLLRAMACGVPAIAGPGPALAELTPGLAIIAQPGAAGLRAALDQALSLSATDRAALAAAALYKVRAGHTLRHTVAGLYAALSRLQARDPAEALARIHVRADAELLAAPPPAAPRGGVAAHKLKAVGRLALTIGAAWEERGLKGARQAARSEFGFFVNRRTPQAAVPAAAIPALPPGAGAMTPLAGSTLLVGYIDAQLGLGQSLRGLASAMDAAGCTFAIHPVGLGVEGRRGPPVMAERTDTMRVHAVNVLEVAANELPNVRAHVGEYRFAHSYNILRPYWELSRAPQAWRPNLAGIDELWAPTTFVAESFRAIFDGPITIVPPCIDLAAWPTDGQVQFGLDPARFHFLFSFDYYSFPQRKNPLGVVRAFRRAFPDPRTPVGLIVKSTGMAGHFPDVKRALRQAARQDGRITIIDESLTRDEMLALMAAAGCYVSLHRAEGFGLGMAEAMAMGKPVIGTDYSGSADFLTPETGFPVACTLRPVRPDEYVHTENQVWAKPDEAGCVRAMQAILADPAAAAARAAAGQRFIRGRLGPLAVGGIAKARLAEIAAR